MSYLSSATVKRGSQKTCFVNLSGELARIVAPRSQNLPQTVVLCLEWPDRTAFVSWSGEVAVCRSDGFTDLSSHVIEVAAQFADSLGLQEGQQVVVRLVESVLSCTRMAVDPVSPDDWEILELHAGYVESDLLNQVRIVSVGDVLPVWIQKNLCIRIKVVSTEPSVSCAKLEEFTEVVIAPRLRTVNSPDNLKQDYDILGSHTATTNRAGGSLVNKPTAPVKSEEASPSHLMKSVASDPQPGVAFSLYGYLRTFFHGDDYSSQPVVHEQGVPETESEIISSERKSVSAEQRLADVGYTDCKSNLLQEVNIELCLRAQNTSKLFAVNEVSSGPCKSEACCSWQPSTVFVHVASLAEKALKTWQESLASFPPERKTISRIVQIQRMLSPREITEQINRNKDSARGLEEIVQSATQTAPTKTGSTGDNRGPGNSSRSSQSTAEHKSPESVVRMVIVSGSDRKPARCPSCDADKVLPGHILMPPGVSQQLDVQYPSLVRLKGVSHPPSGIKGLILHPVEGCTDKARDLDFHQVVQGFQDWLQVVSSDERPLIVTDRTLVAFSVEGESLEFLLSVLSHGRNSRDASEPLLYFLLSPQTMETVTVALGDPGVLSRVAVPTGSGQELKCTVGDLGGVKDDFAKCLAHLMIALEQQPLATQIAGDACTGLRNGALLICGSGAGAAIGCGKTSLAHALCRRLQGWPTYAHVIIVDCVAFRGKRVEIIQKHLQQVFTEAAWHQPTVLLLDDLDQVISAPTPSQEIGGEALYRTRLAEVFKDLCVNEARNSSKIAVMVTSRSRDSLHPSLLTSHGSHLFRCRVELQPPGAGQRREILSLMMKKRVPGMNANANPDLSPIIKKTEGFSPRDLNALVDRAVHVMVLKERKASQGRTTPCMELLLEDFECALDGFKPAALRGVKLHTAGDLGWADVGGLAQVTRTLKETLLWPSKYSSLFNKCPLRLRSGILLYGPPGTGKTLLAGVVAKECGLNFISIKGPELLSKYIGASEQAVRDMFTRAQTAKPCVLFFDEFDSLAPRRGHDSTGVTDRVVNQLLTQLDGVEGLERVYVLAATSRPDLIDPALLRPGRLDKCLYCGIPTKVERAEILRALSKGVLLEDDVALEDVAGLCESFTGADLKALLYNAQLTAIHRSTSPAQLYGTVFSREGVLDQKEGRSSTAKDEETSASQDPDVIYIPSVEKGQQQLSADQAATLRAGLAVVEENFQSRPHRWRYAQEKRVMAAGTEADGNSKVGCVTIGQSDLAAAASSMGPSVSTAEQLKYQRIYESFLNSRGGTFSQASPGQGRATLS